MSMRHSGSGSSLHYRGSGRGVTGAALYGVCARKPFLSALVQPLPGKNRRSALNPDQAHAHLSPCEKFTPGGAESAMM